MGHDDLVLIVTHFQSNCNTCKNGSNALCLQTSWEDNMFFLFMKLGTQGISKI